MIRQLVPSEDFQIPVEKMVNSNYLVQIQRQCKKSAKVAISNTFCTIRTEIRCRMNEAARHLFSMGELIGILLLHPTKIITGVPWSADQTMHRSFATRSARGKDKGGLGG